MPQILSVAELREKLSATYSKEVLNQSRLLRQANINAFLDIDRKGLNYASLEHRIKIYSSQQGEKIYIQLPGKESADSNRNPMPMDFRPKLECSDGTIMDDASFGVIWDILDEIGKQHRDYLSFVAAIFFHMGYMYNYSHTCGRYDCFSLRLEKNNIIKTKQVESVDLCWNRLDISDTVWHSLNNYIGEIITPDGKKISFEAFAKFVDLLLQNEDCKYYFRNVIQGGNQNYNLKSGRTSTCDANLLVLYYLKGEGRISRLLDSFQKSRGVARFNKSDYPLVTDGIIKHMK